MSSAVALYEPHQGVEPAEGGYFEGQVGHAVGLPRPHGDLSGELSLLPLELPLRLLRQIHNLLGPPAQQNPIVCERDMVPATAEQLHPQLLLQLHQLPGEGGLGHMEQGGCPGDVLLPGHHQKIL